jgi:hypothetical protein
MGQALTARTTLGDETTTIGFAEPVFQHVSATLAGTLKMREVSTGWREAATEASRWGVSRAGYAACLEAILKGPHPTEGCLWFSEVAGMWTEDARSTEMLDLLCGARQLDTAGWLVEQLGVTTDNVCKGGLLEKHVESIQWLDERFQLTRSAVISHHLLSHALAGELLAVASWLTERFDLQLEHSCRCTYPLFPCACGVAYRHVSDKVCRWFELTFAVPVQTEDRVTRAIVAAYTADERVKAQWMASHLLDVHTPLLRIFSAELVSGLLWTKHVYRLSGADVWRVLPVDALVMQACQGGDLDSLWNIVDSAEVSLEDVYRLNCLQTSVEAGHAHVSSWLKRRFEMGASYMRAKTAFFLSHAHPASATSSRIWD